MRTRVLVASVAVAFLFACGGTPAGAEAPSTAGSTAPSSAPPASSVAEPSSASDAATAPPSPSTAADAGTTTVSGPMTAKELVGDAGAKLYEGTVAGSQAVLVAPAARPLADVQPKLDATLSHVAHCYTASLKKSGPLDAKRLNVKITIAPDGSVAAAEDGGGSEVADAELSKCVLGHYKKTKFAKIAGKSKDTATFYVVFGPHQP